MIEKALELARRAHEGQAYGEESYFDGHIKQVVRRVEQDPSSTSEDICVALLKDTETTIEDLEAAGFGKGVVLPVIAITRRTGESYMAYISRVAQDRSARLVKIHDLEANLAAGCSETLAHRYFRALAVLK